MLTVISDIGRAPFIEKILPHLGLAPHLLRKGRAGESGPHLAAWAAHAIEYTSPQAALPHCSRGGAARRIGTTRSSAASTRKPKIETAYRELAGMIRLDFRFEVSKVVMVSPTSAFDRSRTAGTTTILANGAQASEGNQAFVVLFCPEDGGTWRIGRYIFSTTQPRG